MNRNAFNRRGISRVVMTSAIAITLGMTALAQNSPKPRMPRRTFQGKIDISNANIAPNITAVSFNVRKAPDRDREACRRGVTFSQPHRLLAQLWIFLTSGRPRRRRIAAWWVRSNY